MCTVSVHTAFYVDTKNLVLTNRYTCNKNPASSSPLLPHQQLPISRHNFSGKIQYYWLSGSDDDGNGDHHHRDDRDIVHFTSLPFASYLLFCLEITSSYMTHIISNTAHTATSSLVGIMHIHLFAHYFYFFIKNSFNFTVANSSGVHARYRATYINILWWGPGWNYGKNYETNTIIDLDGGALWNIYYL